MSNESHDHKGDTHSGAPDYSSAMQIYKALREPYKQQADEFMQESARHYTAENPIPAKTLESAMKALHAKQMQETDSGHSGLEHAVHAESQGAQKSPFKLFKAAAVIGVAYFTGYFIL